MRAYLIRRLLLIIPTLFIVTVIVFMLVRFIPGDVLELMVAEWTTEGSSDIQDVDDLRKTLGLDQPIPIQYGRWLGVWPQETGEFSGIIQGELGHSLWDNEPVIDIFKARLPVSIELGFLSMVIGWSIALPIGIFMATRQDSIPDYTGRVFSIVMLSIPGFWLMTMVIVYPSIWWGAMPNIVYVPITENLFENLKQFLLPAFLTGVASSALTIRLTRTMMLEVLRQDYIRTAWAKGLSERKVLLRHAVKNAFIPVNTHSLCRVPGRITQVSYSLSTIFPVSPEIRLVPPRLIHISVNSCESAGIREVVCPAGLRIPVSRVRGSVPFTAIDSSKDFSMTNDYQNC